MPKNTAETSGNRKNIAGFSDLKKTAVFYFDAQNLYRRAKSVFADIRYPNFDPVALFLPHLFQIAFADHAICIQSIKAIIQILILFENL